MMMFTMAQVRDLRVSIIESNRLAGSDQGVAFCQRFFESGPLSNIAHELNRAPNHRHAQSQRETPKTFLPGQTTRWPVHQSRGRINWRNKFQLHQSQRRPHETPARTEWKEASGSLFALPRTGGPSARLRARTWPVAIWPWHGDRLARTHRTGTQPKENLMVGTVQKCA